MLFFFFNLLTLDVKTQDKSVRLLEFSVQSFFLCPLSLNLNKQTLAQFLVQLWTGFNIC